MRLLHTVPPPAENLRVVLVATRNPLNMGAAARAMSNFGFLHLRVVRPWEPAFREARSAVDAGQVLSAAEQYDSVAEAVADCSLVVGTTAVGPRELEHPVHSLPQAGGLIRTQLAGGRVALLFGSEKTGLSNVDLSHCHWLLRIPTRQEHRSMNLGQAVAVCLYELARDAGVTLVAGQPTDLAEAGQQERFTALLLEALAASGFTKPRTARATEEKVRRMVRRLALPADDVETWTGMLRKMLARMRAGEP
jgi:TrmH family RNA methyltransferase